ncbi:hypothetical protein [Frankia sp. CiP3]|uniref:hypothetical protein n=1 Tax=Frankia sp. CiP3 TaxID=2880971 RepID=UPI001EF5F5A1|nr:hypothetical protein [Frankia sp. CiP3]
MTEQCLRPAWEVRVVVLRSLLTAVEELTLLLLPHGGQRTARRNAWRAAAEISLPVGRIPPQIGGRIVFATER